MRGADTLRFVRQLLVLLACCCSGPPPTKPPGGTPAPSRRGLADYPSVVELSNIDCTFAGPWGADQPRELRFGEGGPVFATAFRTENAHLELGGTAGVVEIDVEGFRFWGHVDHAVLHPARAFVMAGYLIPGFHTTLHPIRANQQQVTVEVVPPKFVKPISAPRESRPCNDVGLALADFDPWSALGNDVHPDSYKLPANTPIPLAASPGGPPVAELRFDGEAYVSVVEQRGELARILVDDSNDREAGTYVVGWVSKAALVPVPNGFGYEASRSVGSGPPVSSGFSRTKRHVRCTHEVPLVVELGTARHLAGAIKPDTKFGVIDAPGDLLEITLDRISLQLAPTARAMVKRTAVGDCSDVPR